MLYINILKYNMDPSILLPWDQADLFPHGTTVYLSFNLTLQLYVQFIPLYILQMWLLEMRRLERNNEINDL